MKSIREYLSSPKKEEQPVAPPIRKTIQKSVASSSKKSNNSGVFKGIVLGFIGLFVLLIGIGILIPDDPKVTPTLIYNNFTSFRGYVDATQLNVRSEPGTTGTDIIIRLKKGDVVSVLNERNQDGKFWYQIDVKGKEGWVSGEYISKSVVGNTLENDQVQLSENEKSVHQTVTPSSPDLHPHNQPVTTYSYNQLVVGSWQLQRLSYDGEFHSVEDYMTGITEGTVFIENAQLAYYLNGSTNAITNSINGKQFETVTYNYQINGTTFTMSNGFIANIDLLTQYQMNITVDSFDGFNNGKLTFYFTKF